MRRVRSKQLKKIARANHFNYRTLKRDYIGSNIHARQAFITQYGVPTPGSLKRALKSLYQAPFAPVC